MIRTKKGKMKKQDIVSNAQPDSFAEPRNLKAESKPSPAISTKPFKGKKSTQRKPELLAPTSISRLRSLQSSTVTVIGKKSKKIIPEPESSFAEEDEEDQNEDDNGHLHGFSTDDDDSSDEEDTMDDEFLAFDVGKLPTVAKDDATVKNKLDEAKRQPVHLLLSLIKVYLIYFIFSRQKTEASCSLDAYLTGSTKIN